MSTDPVDYLAHIPADPEPVTWAPILTRAVPLSPLSHRTLCRVATRWLLTECRYYIAGYEVAVTLRADGQDDVLGVLDAVGVTDPCNGLRVRRRNEDAARKRDALAAAYPDTPWAQRPAQLRKPDRGSVHVIECKVSKADLVADLRARKMLGYERAGSRCSVAMPESVLAAAGGLEGLGLMGLPPTWGVLVPVGTGRAGDWTDWTLASRRDPAKNRAITDDHVAEMAATVGHSMTWRALTTRVGRRENDHEGDLSK